MGEVNIRSVFKISWNLNSFWYFHLASFFQLFFFKAVFLPSISLHKILMRTLFIFFFLTLFLFFFFLFFKFFFFSSLNSFFFFPFFFFLLWILAQTTTLKQTEQIPSWNTMDKGFKKERLIKRLNGVTRDNVSRKRKTHIWVKVDKNGLISSLKD